MFLSSYSCVGVNEQAELVISRVSEIPTLADSRYAIALTGSRTFGHGSDSSDFDFEVLCEDVTFGRLARDLGRSQSCFGVNLIEPVDTGNARVEVTAHRLSDIQQSLARWNDEALWIWTHAVPVYDPDEVLAAMKARHAEYPRKVLESKLKLHYLRDFNLSVHGLDYRDEADNVFSLVHGLSAKIAEYCRIACLLDGSPFPYAKWLLRVCRATATGKLIAPKLDEVVEIVSTLGGGLQSNRDRVQHAIALIDTDVCDIVEAQMVAWGIDRAWIDEAYDEIERDIYTQ